LAQKINVQNGLQGSYNWTQFNQKKHPFFLKSPLKKYNKTHRKSHSSFPKKMYYEVKSKISSTLVQLTVIFFNETKSTATKFEELGKKRRIIQTL